MALSHEEILQRLRFAYGPRESSSVENPLEATVGIALAQNTTRKNVESAIANLKEAGVWSVAALHGLGDADLSELIRPVGNVRVKTRRLKSLVQFLVDRYDGSFEAMFATNHETLREQLLSLQGIGLETADSLLLHAGLQPTFVVDARTARVFKRHGWIEFEADYHAIKDFFESSLESDVELYREYHGLIARVGDDHCRKRPHCEGCPLRDLLPEGGPLEPEWS